MVTSSAEFYIFRDSRRSTTASELLAGLRSRALNLSGQLEIDRLISLLLLAGELECALSDVCADPAVCEKSSCITDLFADAAVECESPGAGYDGLGLAGAALGLLEQINYFGAVNVSAPEGFAYYALHPLDYADLVSRIHLASASALVIGVRSIGTTLSAVVAAGLRRSGACARRITVRPTGDPYNRQCRFQSPEQQAIAEALTNDAAFVICDEGPGRSGSSLLSVAEALEREGVPRAQIVILCSHEPDIDALCAPEAARRWQRYHSAHAGLTLRLPADARDYLGGGEWRHNLVPAGEPWPAVWPQMERLRYGSNDGRSLFTFQGHGPYGEQVRARRQALSDDGFCPPCLAQQQGFGRETLVRGKRGELTPELLRCMAEYCAWRALEFGVPDASASQLEFMVRLNLEREFSLVPGDVTLPVECPTVCDARMMPYAWLQPRHGRWFKLDAALYGDDHFFPGPCDIAWDLAGAIVEWDMSEEAREFFLRQYQRQSGDDASLRIAAYELAYATFRMSWSKMAAASLGNGEEQQRLLADYRKYRSAIQTVPAEAVGRRMSFTA